MKILLTLILFFIVGCDSQDSSTSFIEPTPLTVVPILPTPNVSPSPIPSQYSSPYPSPSITLLPSPSPSPIISPSASPSPRPSPSSSPIQTSTYNGYECDRYLDRTLFCPKGPDLTSLGTFQDIEVGNGFACGFQNVNLIYCWNWYDDSVDTVNNVMTPSTLFPAWNSIHGPGDGWFGDENSSFVFVDFPTIDSSGDIQIFVNAIFYVDNYNGDTNASLPATGIWGGSGILK